MGISAVEQNRKRSKLFQSKTDFNDTTKLNYKYEVEYKRFCSDEKKNSVVPDVKLPHLTEIEKGPAIAPKWRLYRILSGHSGWVRALAVDPTNHWFVSGAGDRLLKIWDLATGTLRLTLTGHVSCIRSVQISDRHPYLFSAATDRMIKCWDLECNKVVRQYHGHLSGVYALSLHPSLNILVSGGRDSTVRMWDIRSKVQIYTLTGHDSTVGALITQNAEYQIISGSHDSTIKLWDIRTGKCKQTLTHHKKSVRALALHPNDSTFASGSPHCIKKWAHVPTEEFPSVEFLQNYNGQQGIANSLCINDQLMVGGTDNGHLQFWDYSSGALLQSIFTPPQSGSLESEAGIFATTFDKSGTRLITAEADKSIKMYKPEE